MLFTYDINTNEIKFIEDIYHYYGFIRYSQDYKAITFSTIRPNSFVGIEGFYTVSGTELVHVLSVGWDTPDSGTYHFVMDALSGEETVITEEESDEYFARLERLDFTPII